MDLKRKFYLCTLIAFLLTTLWILNINVGNNSSLFIEYDDQFNEGYNKNSEWEQLDRLDFISRSGAFYFMNKKLLEIYYISKGNDDSKYMCDIKVVNIKDQKKFWLIINARNVYLSTFFKKLIPGVFECNLNLQSELKKEI